MSAVAAPVSANRLPRRVVSGGLKLAASAAMVALAWRAAGSRLHLGELARLNLAPLTLAFVALNVGQVVAALRLHYTLASLGRKVPFAAVLRAHFVGLWFNQALPTGIGGDVVKVMTLRRHGDVLRYARSVLVTRIIGLAALLASAVLLAPFYGVLVSRPRALYAVAAASSVGLLGLTAIVWAGASRRLASMAPRPARFLLLLARDLRRLSRGSAFWQQLATSTAIVGSICVCFAWIGQSLGHGLGFWTAAVVVPPIIVSMHVPMSYAGWGTREVGAVVVLPLAGVPAQMALAMSILYGLLLLGSGLIGLALWQFGAETFRGKAHGSARR